MPPRRFSSAAISRRRFLQTSAAIAAGLASPGCGWTLAEVRPADAKGDQDKLGIYTWESYIDPELIQTFRTQTALDVAYDIYDSNEVMMATIRSGKGTNYSVVYPSDYAVAEMIGKKELLRLDKSRINGLENLMPEFQNSAFDPNNAYSVPVSWGTTGLIYNADELKIDITDWSDLWNLKQQLTRRMTMLADMREVMGATLKSLGYSYNSDNPAEIQQAYDKLTELKPALATFTTDAWQNQLIAGDYLLCMAFSMDAVSVMQENPDLNLRYVIPKSGTSLWNDTMAILSTAPNLDAAYEWINYMLQPAIAVDITKRLFFATPNQSAYDQLPNPLRNNQSLFPPEAILKPCERLTNLEPKIAELYDRYWTRLTSK